MKFTIPLQIIELEHDGFHPLVEVVVSGKTFILVLDTGASKTALDKKMLKQANEETEFVHSDKLSTGLGTTTMKSFTVTIQDMRIGKLKIPAFDVAVLDLSSINVAYSRLNKPKVLGVLGGDILMRHKAIINYANSSMILHQD